MYGKLVISCKMKVLTGMHIGGSNVFSAIGSVDSPVIRDSLTGLPLLPGSSLKGKMRTLLAKAKSNRYILDRVEADPPEISRLFGSPGNLRSGSKVKPARLQFADCFIANAKIMKERGGVTEVKFENTIDRITSIANPRQIERVTRGAEFDVRMVYNIEEEGEIQEDFENVAHALKLVSMDYLGGHGSRGYGRVSFNAFEISDAENVCPVGLEILLSCMKDVEQYALYTV